MLSGHRSARRRHNGSSRAARFAIPFGIPLALGLTLGLVLAVSGHPVMTLNQSALGACASPAADVVTTQDSAAAATPVMSASPEPASPDPAASPHPAPTT